MERIPFRYWHFYDYPRNILLSVQGHFFYLHSPFLDDEDEFATYYRVYELINFASEEELNQRIKGCYYPPLDMLNYIGDIPIAELDFPKNHKGDIAALPFREFLIKHNYGFLYRNNSEDNKPD